LTLYPATTFIIPLKESEVMTIEHYRHATSIMVIDGKRILIDPVFADRGTYPPIVNSRNTRRNPLIDLPVNYGDLGQFEGVLITHNHNDHFDEIARKALPRDIPLLCQEEDRHIYRGIGFTRVTGVVRSTAWLGLTVGRFAGYHGGHLLRKMLGTSSSYFIESPDSQVYITGDTLLTGRVRRNLRMLSPGIIIANGGGARLKILGKLTMDNRDILKLSRLLPGSRIIAVHMDSLNHCSDTREKLKRMISSDTGNILIPGDGEILTVG
jgi:L-ascorbate metabolism protein UlaG (beta-lactamase superfamily)